MELTLNSFIEYIEKAYDLYFIREHKDNIPENINQFINHKITQYIINNYPGTTAEHNQSNGDNIFTHQEHKQNT